MTTTLPKTLDELKDVSAPYNPGAEMALLGALLNHNAIFDRVGSYLKPEHFAEAVHAELYRLMARLIGRGHTVTAVTLLPYAEEIPGIEDLGGAAEYLGKLVAQAAPMSAADDYAREIYDLARRRWLMEIGSDLVVEAKTPDADSSVNDIIEETEKRLYEVAEEARFGQGFVAFSDALKESITMAAAAYARDGGLSGLATGLRDLDQKMGGLQPSDLIILAGRPGMGKTALATSIAYHVARTYKPAPVAPGEPPKAEEGGIVAFFSLEMSAEQLATRIVSSEAEISSHQIRRGDITPEEFRRLQKVAREIEQAPLFIDDTGGLTIAQLAARARRIKRQHGLDLIVVDYLQLLSGTSRRAQENRVQELTEITTNLKALAKELNVPILALSQLSRQVESREDKRPQLSDLRESGSIEQDADVVLFIFREEYYLKQKEPPIGSEKYAEWMEQMEQVHGIAEIIIAKQRHGPVGKVEVQFTENFTRFADLEKHVEIPEGM